MPASLQPLVSLTYAELLSILSDQKYSKTELGTRSSLDTRALAEYIGTVLKFELATQSGNHTDNKKGEILLERVREAGRNASLIRIQLEPSVSYRVRKD